MLTIEEEGQFITLLDKMGTEWTPRLYNAMAPRFALTAIETVCLRGTLEGRICVLLTQRPDSDVHYPGQWHSPGTMLRASDVISTTEDREILPYDGFKAAFDRLTASELGVGFAKPPQQVKSIFHWTARGPEKALVFLCLLSGEPKKGKFFNVRELPENLIEHHYRIIAAAVEGYKQLEWLKMQLGLLRTLS